MNKAIIGTFCAAALGLSACSQPESTPATPTPAPVATVAAIATPAPPPAPTGDMMKVKTGLESALTEVKNKNYTGAVSLLDSAHKELTVAAANAPAAAKAGLQKAGTTLETVKGLVEKKDPGAEKGLSGLLANVTKLAAASSMAAGAKEAAAGAASALGGMVKGAADATKGAAAGAGGAMKGAAEKAMPAKK